jgi:hypothetical protein
MDRSNSQLILAIKNSGTASIAVEETPEQREARESKELIAQLMAELATRDAQVENLTKSTTTRADFSDYNSSPSYAVAKEPHKEMCSTSEIVRWWW